MPTFKCRNTGKQCRFEVEADTEAQVLEEAKDHWDKEHGSDEPLTIKQIRKAIRDYREKSA
jgi:predicted small metal-binding protein